MAETLKVFTICDLRFAVWFGHYRRESFTKSAGDGSTPVNYSNTVSGLTVGTLYHFSTVATNATGNSSGADFTFTTLPATTPTITTNFASIPGVTNVTLNGGLNANGLPSGAWFEWGLTTNYGNATMATNLGGGTTNQTFSLSVGGLAVGATYYFRTVATNRLGAAYGIGQSFITALFANVTNVPGGLTGVNSSSVIWGDYDNDGLLDYLAVGTSYSGMAQIWHNTGSGFENVTATVAPGLQQGAYGFAAWGDFDNDGRLDFIIGGEVLGSLCVG